MGSTGMAAHLLDEAGEVEGDLGIGRAIIGGGGRDGLRLAEAVDLTTQGTMVPRADCQTSAAAKPADSISEPKAISRQFLAWTRAEPMRSSQTWRRADRASRAAGSCRSGWRVV